MVISSGGKGDSDELQWHHLEEAEEQAIRKAFRKPIPAAGTAGINPAARREKYQDLHILIVTEKLLTGFDAPILYCMYLGRWCDRGSKRHPEPEPRAVVPGAAQGVPGESPQQR